MSDSLDWRIIDRHLAGEASASDDAALKRWLDADARNAALLDGLRSSRVNRWQGGERFDVDSAWMRLSGRLAGERPTRHLAIDRARGFVTARGATWRLAAVVATLAASVTIAMVWRTPRASSSSAASPMRVVASGRAQRTHLTLRDGSRVDLNAGSTLRYAEDFGDTSRELDLDGEGYFDVVHDPSIPFRVRTRGGVAEDLGTRFAVRAYPGAPVQVVVAQGLVSLRRETSAFAHRTLLEPGQLGRIERDGRVTVLNDVNVDRWVSWTRGALVLDGLSLSEAAEEIGRRYDVRVVVPDEALARRRVTSHFQHAPLSTVLDALALALGARWSNDGVVIVIRRAE